MKKLLTIVCCLGFLLFATTASAQNQGCPQATPVWCDPGPCELGNCATSQSNCYNSPAPLGSFCFFLGEPGACDGHGVCVEECVDEDGDGECDPPIPLADPATCEGDKAVLDPATGLCWLKDPSNTLGYNNAQSFCDELSNGYEDWRMPIIDELRSIIEGCPAQELGGTCQVTDPDCLSSGTCQAGCATCPFLGGGNYYGADFLNQNGLATWSESPVSEDPTGEVWFVAFNTADIRPISVATGLAARCVRDVASSGGPQTDVFNDSVNGDAWHADYIFDVEPGSDFDVTLQVTDDAAASGANGGVFLFVQWDQRGNFGNSQCFLNVSEGETDSCPTLSFPSTGATQAHVAVKGLQFGAIYELNVTYSPVSAGCPDADGDGICDADDICPGFDDTLDADGDGVPDGCDICPLDNPDDPDGNGICGDQGSLSDCTGPGVAEDAANSLCWMYETAPSALNFAGATNYCDALMLDSYDDWRLPTIDELRMIVEGCPSQEYGGSCGVTDPDCLDSTCDDAGCSSCSYGNYLAFYLSGSTETTISSSPDGGGSYWAVRYANAYMFRRGSVSANTVRCVRDTAACQDSDGDGVCDADDICPGFDDTLDADGDGTPDGCDICPLDNPDDPDGNGICGDQGSLPSCTGPNVAEDLATGLCWQDPEHTATMEPAPAIQYCNDLVLDGYDDWHLPTISELRTIIQNCPVQQAGGACGITDSCLDRSTCDAGSCSWCALGGDYLLSSLSALDPNHRLSSSSVDPNSGLYYSVEFYSGYIRSSNSVRNVRCVRIP